jgi:streptomycin 6-kinase
LTRAGGLGAVRLLDCAPGEGALLLERLEPGNSLVALVPEQDERACEVLAAAERTAADLLRTAPADVLLHADLHHENVLWDRRRGWLAIDPHGLTGDPAYEFAPLLHNPLSMEPYVADLALHRCARLAEASGIEQERIRAWGFVQAVLSAVWSLDEDPVPDAHVLAVAARLRAG